jgi:phenylacetate-CoA ligase
LAPTGRSLRRGLAIFADCWRLHRAQRRDREWLRRLQEAKLRAIVDHAWRTVPFHRERFQAAGIRPADVRAIADLAALPPTTKAELQAAGVEARTSSAYQPAELDTGLTSGSTGQPFPFARDPDAMRLRKALFLRALAAIGYRPGDRVLLLDAPRENLPPPWLRWHYVRPTVPVEDQLKALQELRPAILYASRPTTLGLLARFARGTGAPLHRPRALVTTGETLGPSLRDYLQASFAAPVFDVYGAVETGTIAWECRAHRGLHVAEDALILEFLPSAHGEVQRLVLTSLENRGMPLIRYDIGDLGAPLEDGSCACGSRFRRIERVEGRLVDCLRLPDGRLVPPNRLEHAVRRIEGVERFQVVQERPDSVLLRLHGQGGPLATERAERALADLVGADVRVQAQWEASLDPPPGQKFRLVERRAAAGPDPF